MLVKNKRFVAILLTAGLILIIPLIAMQITSEVNWTLSDFVIAGFLLISSGIIIELVLRNVKKANIRMLLTLGVIAVLVLVWAELAVGIFGTPFAGD